MPQQSASATEPRMCQMLIGVARSTAQAMDWLSRSRANSQISSVTYFLPAFQTPFSKALAHVLRILQLCRIRLRPKEIVQQATTRFVDI